MKRLPSVEPLLAVGPILWGAWLVWPYWDSFGASPTFAGMERQLPEWAWGALFIAAGLVWLTGCLIHARWLRRVGTMACVLLWFFVAWLFAVTSLPSTASPAYFWIAVIDSFVFVRSEMEYRAQGRPVTI